MEEEEVGGLGSALLGGDSDAGLELLLEAAAVLLRRRPAAALSAVAAALLDDRSGDCGWESRRAALAISCETIGVLEPDRAGGRTNS